MACVTDPPAVSPLKNCLTVFRSDSFLHARWTILINLSDFLADTELQR
jgi:hypothetical protein